jgi:hypothetical protein
MIAAKIVLSVVVMISAIVGTAIPALAQSQTVSILIVRHPESDNTQPTIPLSERGRARAELLIHTLRGVKFTHVYSSHTTRSRQAVERIAAAHNLTVVQLPAPGSVLDGKPVTDQTTRRAPIEPVSEALLKLPAGSTALVGLNSENIYAILNRLGVPLAPSGQSCAQGSMCVPCTSNECYPGKEFDHLWHVVRQPGRTEPLAYLELRYGAGWPGPRS